MNFDDKVAGDNKALIMARYYFVDPCFSDFLHSV